MSVVTRLATSQRGLTPRAFRFLTRTVARGLERLGMARHGASIRTWLDERRAEFISTRRQELEDLLKSGTVDLLLDLGAHIGEQALPASDHVPVIAFEPDPVAAARLRALISSRTTRFPITLHEAAAWDSEGVSLLRSHKRGPATTGSSSMMIEKRNLKGGADHGVRTVDIGEFVEGLPQRSILVKCDVEGAEYRVLGALLQRRLLGRLSAVYTEYHDAKVPGAWARSIGFSLRLVSRRVQRDRYLREWI